MVLDGFDEIVIKKYFDLKCRIKKLQEYKAQQRYFFYQQTMNTYLEYNALGIHSASIKFDNALCDLYERMDVINRRIARNRFRYKEFQNYLDNLPYFEKRQLELKYAYHNEITIEVVQSII